jgi:site-specific recombinase XerD
LLDAPDTATLKGARDQVILAVLLGCGLRRSELVALTFGHLQQRDGRWAIVDIVGKGNRVRTVPMPACTRVLIDKWALMAAARGAPRPGRAPLNEKPTRNASS